ncbi:MAG TPA: TauD/TfdA family dioxygenase [Methylomirabilota bacterium]|nr:TauD/TfdA family dioxygenase [Methylomirabilota bacterium]
MPGALTDTLTIRRLSAALGAEVLGVDLAQPLDAATLRLMREAFQEHHVLCFREQRLTDAELMAFSLQFGPLEAFPEKDKTKGTIEVYNVANVSPEGVHLPAQDPHVIFQRNNARWHTDSSYRFVPSLASILYGVEVLPEGAEGGETGFSNMLLAYEALPDAMKRRLEPLHMVHHYDGIRRLEPEMPPTAAVERDAFPPVSHPVIRVHPDRAGRRSLYFTCNTAREIGGGTLEEGQALHDWLREHVSQPRFCYYHRWRLNDLVMWDNRCLLHRAIPYDYARYRRVLRRTTVAGSGPVVGPFSVGAGAAGGA